MKGWEPIAVLRADQKGSYQQIVEKCREMGGYMPMTHFNLIEGCIVMFGTPDKAEAVEKVELAEEKRGEISEVIEG